MGVIAYANVNDLLDDLVEGYQKALGDASSGKGMGEPGDTFGLAGKMDDLITEIGTSATDAIADLLPAAQSMKATFSLKAILGARVRAFLNRLDRHIRVRDAGALGLTSLDAYLTYYNVGAGGTWLALQHSDFRTIFNQAKGGGNYPKAYHLYFEVLQGSTYTNGLRKFVGTGAGAGTQTAGYTIASGSYAGGFPKVKISGLTGTGTITVTGTAFDPATMTTEAGVTWTFAATVDGTFDLVEGTAPTDSLIVAVSNIATAAGITAGTIYVEAHKPTGRL